MTMTMTPLRASALFASVVLLLPAAHLDRTPSTTAPAPPPPIENPFDAVPLEILRQGDAIRPSRGLGVDAASTFPSSSASAKQDDPTSTSSRSGARAGGDPGRLPFLLEIRDIVVPYPIFAISALPDELIEIRVAEAQGVGSTGSFLLRTEGGFHEAASPGRWHWKAPSEPGVYALRVESSLDDTAVHLNVMVLHPFDPVSQRSLNGYRIGRYRSGAGRSVPPEGFIEAGAEFRDLLVSPNFTLEQFLCKQAGDPPYLALSEPLVLKLEAILEEVRASGIAAETLTVMSGFRTPSYNEAIGNTTTASRHLWGDAADIFIDTTGDGRMDDLNGDGRVDTEDAMILREIVERVEARGEPHVQPGGLSLYRANAVRGPFLHVDARGGRARW
jgi:hypothetical protein